MEEFNRFTVTEFTLWGLPYEGRNWDPFFWEMICLLSYSLKKDDLKDSRSVSYENGSRTSLR
jgi:hypothetical protein